MQAEMNRKLLSLVNGWRGILRIARNVFGKMATDAFRIYM